MDLDNDELAYTRFFREIKAYKKLKKMTFWKVLFHFKEYKKSALILTRNFEENFNKKVSKEGRLK